MMGISEKSVEQRLRRYAESRGILFWKFVSPSHNGVPDRIVIGPSGFVYFLEVKALGKKPTPLQMAMHNLLRAHGMTVHVVDNFEDGKAILDGLA